jgi:hypothetical protein
VSLNVTGGAGCLTGAVRTGVVWTVGRDGAGMVRGAAATGGLRTTAAGCGDPIAGAVAGRVRRAAGLRRVACRLGGECLAWWVRRPAATGRRWRAAKVWWRAAWGAGLTTARAAPPLTPRLNSRSLDFPRRGGNPPARLAPTTIEPTTASAKTNTVSRGGRVTGGRPRVAWRRAGDMRRAASVAHGCARRSSRTCRCSPGGSPGS